MRWPAAIVFAATCTVGCHSSPPVFDPFLPRTRIPPPGTGAATGAPDANYINPAPPYSNSAPPYAPAPATGAPATSGANGPYAPPGGYHYQQSAPTSGGLGGTPGPVNSSQVLPSSPRSSDERSVVLASHDDSQSTCQNRSVAEKSQPRTQSGQVLRASYVTAADSEPSTVYERRRAAKATGPATPDDSSSEAIDIMDLPPVSSSR